MKTIFKSLTAAAALSAAITSTATAQDAEKWEGFYAGGKLNMQSLDFSGAPINLGSANNFAVFGGYNHAIAPNWVLGGELEYGSAMSHNLMGPVDIDLENNINLRARGGYAFGNSLVYGTAGYGWSDWDVDVAGFSGSADGFSYGVGFETLLSENVSTRFEYTRTDYDFSGPGLAGQSGEVDRLSVGIAYKF